MSEPGEDCLDDYPTLESIDKEIARLQKHWAAGPKPRRIWTPWAFETKIRWLRRMRLKYTHPRVWAVRVWIATKLIQLGNRVYP